jgi:hypothetical protein
MSLLSRGRFFLVVSTTLFSHFALAQFTIQKSDVQQYFKPGASVTLYSDTTTMVNVGLLGGPNVYDFSSLKFPDSMQVTMYSVSQIPQLASRFPGAGLVWGASTQSINSSSLFFFTDTSFVTLASVSITADSQEYDYSIPNELILAFPTAYQDTWTTVGEGLGVDSTFANNAVEHVSTGWNHASTYTVDGYGTLMVMGHSYPCLRRREVEPDSYEYQGFNYFTSTGLILLVGSNKNQPDTGVVAASHGPITVIKFNSTASAVAEGTAIPTSMSLSQNYPNPFNPSTRIEFSLPSAQHVVLRIYDVLGRAVATLVDGGMSEGTHSVEWAPLNNESGVYFYRLQTDGATLVKKLLYLK